ncbi:hypothetical protein C6P40_003175 [Pichia californica]|uniref:Protein transport protein SFT2 n=1 Tax=Pichia californica TaxID=460514 RepID=A0A9P6WNI3_9ASCO|nr:hypothetical protein C6P42_004274 [[Candida] californica]KAG0690357.1 hypothetical protein C6P40_003175 [[Candida] californica]
MSDDNNAAFISNWRTTRSTNTNDFTNNASSFFSNLGTNITNKLQDTMEGAQNVLPLNTSDILGGSTEEPSWFTLSRFERYVGFALLLLGSVACFALGFFLFPVLTLKPRKFVMLWTLGSLLFFLSFGVLQGPVSYCKHLASKERLPFTIIFVTSQILTIYCAIVLKSTLFSLIMGIVEIMSILWYTASYFPFGTQTMQYVFGAGARQVSGMVGL